jgi:transposase-like protein
MPLQLSRRRQRDGVSSEAVAEIRALKRRNAELEQTIDVLKAATSFFVRASDARTTADRCRSTFWV